MRKFSKNALWLYACIALASPYFPAGVHPASSESAKETIESAVPTDVTFDAEWYLSTYPDVRAAVQAGSIKSALDHYRAFGYFEKRLPSKPVVDEAWYLKTYPDVAQAIREGRSTSAYDHFVKFGYREGRMALQGQLHDQQSRSSILPIPPDLIKPATDGRAVATQRLSNVTDFGIIIRHSRNPGDPDFMGARDVWVFKYGDTYYMHYDGAGPKGWLSNLATSKDLFNWEKNGPILDFGPPGSPDSASASYGTVFFEDSVWYLFYLGTPSTSPAPQLIPQPPYYTMTARASSPVGPWTKTTKQEALPLKLKDGSYYQDEVSPGHIVKNGAEYLMFFSGAKHIGDNWKRTVGIARTQDLRGEWSIDAEPAFPMDEQIENSSLFYQSSTKTWFLFTNHLGLDEEGREEANAVWVYWSKDLNNWNPKNKAVVLDTSNVTWTKGAIGLPSILQVGDRLAVFYDGSAPLSFPYPGERNMDRDIGLAFISLPILVPD
jgi:predicted GH43/DUF377 family glycosyl hydrolase